MQYQPPRGPVQTLPLRQLQSPGAALLRWGWVSSWRGLLPPPISALQLRLLPLTDPSLHTKVSPAQCETPPFLPEQG